MSVPAHITRRAAEILGPYVKAARDAEATKSTAKPKAKASARKVS